ncbi:hypothetical protein C7M61_002973 [Candidozyma pseudohaemuli]|uniref:SH3 domain-containing protein n=1 Tax=Candidozyma pseudohaemuli TaxID=418784 RepID=A0A2P7YR18_9ASCO|nr:hypothetical protein C7M61_002973 [[Candida] pseudohaemulonii]PSK38410.1 hypothetical protein C7M61_002973 [[Candida] pseudohaemulonii]
MSAALINRSLTNIRTELEFLHDSEVIDEKLFNALLEALPQRYSKGMAPWGAEKLSAEKEDPVEEVSQSLQKSTIQDEIKEPANPARVPPRKPAGPIGYCKALYNYEAQEADDLALSKDDKLAVVEHLSLDWWKGCKLGQGPDQAGVFPSNYVSVILETEFQQTREKAPINEKATFEDRAQSPSAPPYDQVVPQPTYPQYPQNGQNAPYGQYQSPQNGYGQSPQNGYGQMQPSYGGYSQYPPPSANYYPQQQQVQQMPQEQQVEQSSGEHGKGHEHVKKFGGKLGNAAIFGAGATIGSNIVNSIF